MGDAIKVPIIVRLQGTNSKIAKDIIDNSGLNVLSAIEFQEAADKVQKTLSNWQKVAIFYIFNDIMA